MQDGIVRQRLDRRGADEGGQGYVPDDEFVPVVFEIVPEDDVGFVNGAADLFERPDARHFFGQEQAA